MSIDKYNILTEKQKNKFKSAYKQYLMMKEVTYDHIMQGNNKILIENKELFSDNTDLARRLSGSIFDASKNKSFHTGLYSLDIVNSTKKHGYNILNMAGIKNIPTDEKPTVEHATGGLHVAKSLLKEDTKTFQQFINFLYLNSFVNITTVEENNKLRVYNKNHDCDWLEAYENVGIKLCMIYTKREGRKIKLGGNMIIEYSELREHIENPYFFKEYILFTAIENLNIVGIN